MKKLLYLLMLVASIGVAQAGSIYITEFKGAPPLSVYYQAAAMPSLAKSAVTITSSSTQSSVFNTDTGLVRIQCSVLCSVEFGTSPMATNTSIRLLAGQTEYFIVPAGTGYRLAVIAGPT